MTFSADRESSSKGQQWQFIKNLCVEDLREVLIPKGKGTDSSVGPDLTEYGSVLGKLNWLQSRMQFGISYYFSMCASASANTTLSDAKELNKVVRLVKDKPQSLLYAPLYGTSPIMGFPDAIYKNYSDGSSQKRTVYLHLSTAQHGEEYKGVVHRP